MIVEKIPSPGIEALRLYQSELKELQEVQSQISQLQERERFLRGRLSDFSTHHGAKRYYRIVREAEAALQRPVPARSLNWSRVGDVEKGMFHPGRYAVTRTKDGWEDRSKYGRQHYVPLTREDLEAAKEEGFEISETPKEAPRA